MHLTQKFLAFTLMGAEWVLWLLIGLSCISVAIMFERGWFFFRHHFDLEATAEQLKKSLRGGDLTKARGLLAKSDSVEANVLNAGLAEYDRGADAVGEAMLSAKAR